VRAVRAEELLRGLEVGATDGAAAAAEAAAEEAGATADANGAVDYKRALVATLVRRAFAAACAA
jgi:CO/xanthine dehydrogenase FAD-binding subunit